MKIIKGVLDTIADGGFTLKSFNSNSNEFLYEPCPTITKNAEFHRRNNRSSESGSGYVIWNTERDTIGFNVKLGE